MSDAPLVGYVVGEVRTDAFSFVTNPELAPPRLEYVCVRGVQEPGGDGPRQVDLLAQVSSLGVSSRLLEAGRSYGEVEAILRRLGSSPPVMMAQAKVLGYLDEQGSVRLPRGAAMPGAMVERAPDELLARFFGRGITNGLQLGRLINRPQVEVVLDPNGLRRHLAVIAQTGAGKSYTVGVLLEELLALGGTVLVFDPNSDYVLMGRQPDGRPTPFANRVQVYRTPGEQLRRIPDERIGRVEELTVRFSGLDADEVCDVAGIGSKATNIRYAVQKAIDRLGKVDYSVEALLDELRLVAGDGANDEGSGAAFDPIAWADRSAGSADADLPAGDDPNDWFDRDGRPAEAEAPRARARSGGQADGGQGGRAPSDDQVAGSRKALKYMEYMARLRIWGFKDLPMERLLRPMTLTTVDLAGVDRRIADFVVTKIVSDLWKQATRDGLDRPVFLVLEEAHNFVPAGPDDGRAGFWLRRIAAEGRKFGIFLVLVTQRPNRVHQDTLSQCGSQIIMRLTNPEDQSAIRRASESMSEGLLADLPGLNQGEAVVLGPLVRVPVMVRVRARRSDEGGADIDLAKALEDARAEAGVDQYRAAGAAARAARPPEPWREEI